jgi:hypothetical protein
VNIKKAFFRLLKALNRMLFRVRIDDNSRINPLNDVFGYRRGTPIDRFYIQKAIGEYSKEIKGSVLEVGGNEYTKCFSQTEMADSFILNYSPMEGNNVIVGDLADSNSLKGLKFDTFICTQTLNFIYDFKAAIDTSYELLTHGGFFIGTVASVSNISKYDDSRWGDYWRFSYRGISAALEHSRFEIADITGYGNVLAAKAMFDGCVVEDFDNKSLLDHVDPVYPLIISFSCWKP